MIKRGFYFQDCIRINNDIWFASGDYNGLYRYNVGNKRTERVALFPNEPFYQESLYIKICFYDNNLIFIPQYGKRINIYNLYNKLLVDIEIPNLTESIQPPYFCEAVVYKQYLFMMGAKYPGIIKVNLENYEVEIIDQRFIKLQNEICMNIYGIFLGTEGVLEANKFFIPCYQCNKVLEINLDIGEYCLYEVGSKNNQYARIIKAGDTFVLVTHNVKNDGYVVFWDYEKDTCEEVHFEMRGYVDRAVIEYLGDIWILSYASNEICRVGIRDKQVNYYSVPDVDNLGIIFARVVDNELLFCDYYTQSWYKINNSMVIEKVLEKIDECVSEKEIEKRLLEDEFENKLYDEKTSYLEFFIKKVQKSETLYSDKKSGALIGKNIYKLCN
ncbi:MAG: hypothetical protein K2N73_15065 [Lachnospiraceae bacterium]|nr:hypothetical protein [Lachnospiraceae bacterium]